MINEDKIKDRAKYYETELYGKVRSEQKIDNEYINDEFQVPEIHKPHTPLRHGYGRAMIDGPAESVITSNPQVYVEVTTGLKESETKIASMFNDWVSILRRQNPNPFKESVKNPLARGENEIKLAHNEAWVTGDMAQVGLPVHFLIPDPMVIYSSPDEDENGIPAELFILYERQPWDVIVNYPHWTKKDLYKEGKKKVKWLEYWCKDGRHFEADGEVVLRGKNPYGFVPFIRRYSGFGKRSPSGELADLIISDIRHSRGMLYDECLTASNLSSSISLFAHAPVTITSPGTINADNIRESFSLGAYKLNILDNLPDKTEIKYGDRIMPPGEMFIHYERILSQLNQRCPFLLAGFPFGTSGTQQRMSVTEGMRRYLTIVENTETAFATAFEKAFEIIKKIPKLRPKELTKRDLECEIRCRVVLKARDPVEENRLSLMGSRLLLNKEIDPITNLTEYKGYTQERSIEILINMLAWQVVLNDPDVIRLIGMRAAEKSGMLEELKRVQQQSKGLETALGGGLTPSREQRVRGEVKTERGMEAEPEEAREARVSPELYTRGGAG